MICREKYFYENTHRSKGRRTRSAIIKNFNEQNVGNGPVSKRLLDRVEQQVSTERIKKYGLSEKRSGQATKEMLKPLFHHWNHNRWGNGNDRLKEH